MVKNALGLVLILGLAGVLRFWGLEGTPPSLSWDETAIGYNAWSILKTGRDEYGILRPLLFKSFDDYKLPGMVYATVLSEAVFGLNEWGVRIPSAVFGTLMILVMYFLIKEFLGQNFKHQALSSKQISNSKSKISKTLAPAILVALLAAVNPWLVNFSRQAFESNGSAFWFVLGIYGLLKSVKNIKWLIAAAAAFGVSLYFYYSARVVLPLVLFVFVAVYFDYLRKNWRLVLAAATVGILILLPLAPWLFSKGGFSRISMVAAVNDSEYISRQVLFAQKILENNNSFLAKTVYNRRLVLALTIGANYLKNISFKHLFVDGTGNFGLFYWWEAPFLILGLFFLLTEKVRFKWVILAWILASPLAGALTRDQPNALRTLIGAPGLVVLSGLGIYRFWEKTRKIGMIVGVVGVVGVVGFLRAYFDDMPKNQAFHFGDGYKQLAQYLKEENGKYNKIWVSGEYWRPYIHLLFHLKYEPGLYQQEGNLNGFGKFYFGKAGWDLAGVDLGEAELGKLAAGKTLFALSNKEYERQIEKGQRFSKTRSVDGRYAKNVFQMVELE